MARATTRGGRESRAARQACLERAARRMSVPDACDVCVVGCGAAGTVAATVAAEAGASVVALDAAAEVARTILATGNGRCNLSNERVDPARYNAPDFVSPILGDDAGKRVLAWFDGCGLACTSIDGRLYPRSLSAASVRDVLLARAAASGAALAPMRGVTRIERTTDDVGASSGGDLLVTYRESFDGGRERMLRARCVVVALGGPRDGLACLEPLAGLGLSLAPASPVLCPIACRMDGLAALDGRRATARITLERDGDELAAEAGELLFREYGVSGIAVFDLSRVAAAGDTLRIDLVPEKDEAEVERMLSSRDMCVALRGLVSPEIADALLGSMAEADAAQAARLIKGLRLRVTGLADTGHAQVTRGGLLLGDFNARTLAAHGVEGLFACGEALDVDADCGGFNLTWAWLSGQVAGANAAALATGAARTDTTP